MTQAVTKRDTQIRVAVADGEPTYLRALRQILSSQPDMQLIAEVSSADAVSQMLRLHRPDILLLELELSLAAGLSILQDIRGRRWMQSRIIILTKSGDERDCVDAIKCGAVGLLEKSCGTQTLLRCIRQVHAGEVWVDERTTAAVVRALRMPQSPSSGTGDNGLSRREREVVELVARGLRNVEIAEKLSLRHGTVKQHLHNIYTKLGVESRTGLAVYAVQQGWLSPESIAATGGLDAPPRRGSEKL